MVTVSNSRVLRVIPLLIAVCLVSFPAYAKYGGGTGEPNDPYQIATADDLMLLGESPEDCDKHFILTADIDLDPNLPRRKVFDRAVIPWFGGTFDGNNLTISHLTIEGGGYLGLFGRLSWGAEVKDLGVVDVNITSSGDQVGGLVGENRGYVTQCYSTGSVTGVNYVGGLVGKNGVLGILRVIIRVPEQYFPVSLSSTIYNCYSTAYVTGNTGVGGLLGSNSGDVTQCYSKAVVIGNSSVGGLAGANLGDGTIARCYAICTIRKAFRQWQADESIGGLVGTNFGTPGSWGITWYPSIPASVAVISDCYSIVSGDSQVSGLLVGQNGEPNSKGWFSSISPGRIVNCYAACDSSGTVEATGLVGRNYGLGGAVLNCFWDAQACGVADNAEGGTPKTTAEMQMAGTFLDADWGGCVDEVIWTIDEGNDYPRLWWEDKAGQPLQARLSELLEGDGTEESPYTIYTLEDINTIARFPCEHDKHFRLGFLSGEGTQENPYLIYTTDELDLLSMCPYEQDAYFRLGFVTGEGTQESPYLIYTANELNLLNMCPYERDAYFKLGFIAGEGTQESPYLIYTADELNLLSICPYELDKHFKLMADIDLLGFSYDAALVAPDINNATREFDGTPFTGVFDGNGHAISHLTIEGGRYLGLFGRLESGAEVKNLGLVDVNINGSDTFVGGLAGGNGSWDAPGGSVTNCYSTGTVTGDRDVGGLVGWNYEGGTVTNCYSTSTVTGEFQVGGLVGENSDGNITMSYSTGTVTGEIQVGGLAGMNYEGDITDSYSTGMVSGIHGVGGLVANNQGLINTSFSTGTVTGDEGVGGLVGFNNARIFTSYSTGEVTGETEVGGLVGKNREGIITTSYSTGAVIGNDLVGGLVGSNYKGTIIGCFWDIQTSGKATSAGGIGKKTAEMQMSITFYGWGGWDNEGNGLWTIDEGNDYPRLWWENKPGELLEGQLSDFLQGAGTEAEPYLIYTAHQFDMIGRFPCEWGKHFKLMVDIDLGAYIGTDFNIISYFRGVFDGNGKKISNFNCTSTDIDYIGLFGCVSGENAEIKDLGLIDPNIDTGAGNCVGSLVGRLREGTITGCYIEGCTVKGDYNVGGLVGENYHGIITNCYSAGLVTGERNVGGLAGCNWGDLIHCYSTCAVSGNDFVGGLVGSYYRTTIGCFWDIDTSSQAASAGGIGKTTTEMQTASTFLEAGWDFVDETENGTEEIWWILDGRDYPRLWWEEVSELED